MEIKEVYKAYFKKNQEIEALKGVSLKIEKGINILLGPNGAGKTTLVRIIAGTLKADKGEILIRGKNILKNKNLQKECISVMFEEVDNCYGFLTVEENLLYFGFLYRIKEKELREKIDYLLNLMKLEEKRKVPVNYLSQGMKKRVAVAITLLKNADYYILDEPQSGMDVFTKIVMKEIIKKFSFQGKKIVITTHDMFFAEDIGDNFIFINQGKIVKITNKKDLFNVFKSKRIYRVKFLYNNEEIKTLELNEKEFIDFCIKLQEKEGRKKILDIEIVSPTLEEFFKGVIL